MTIEKMNYMSYIKKMHSEIASLRQQLESATIDAGRYRHLRSGLQGGAYPEDGSVWVVLYKHPQGTIPETRSAGIGEEMDRNVDAAMEAVKEKENP